MTSSYKRIGDFIQLVDVRNRQLDVELLLGLSKEKVFIASVANTIGTDMGNYKIIKRGQFACNLIQVRRDKKIPVALMREYDEALISQAYQVFEVCENKELLPEYLMMWMSRSEFDRHACFLAVGGVRGSLDWEDFCDIELPVPDIQIQKEVIRKYTVLADRIKLNQRLCIKLEETTKALYTHWFIDYEFPISAEYAASIGKPDLQGKPYKSSGGEMIYNEKLDHGIPKSWSEGVLTDLASLSAGGDKPRIFSEFKTQDCSVPIYSNSTDNEGLYGYTDKAKVTGNCLTVSARGAIIGYTVMRIMPFVPIVRLITVKPKAERYFSYLYEAIKNFRFDSGASAQGQLTVPDFSSFKVIIPDQNTLTNYQNIAHRIFEIKRAREKQTTALRETLKVLAAQMSNTIAKRELVE